MTVQRIRGSGGWYSNLNALDAPEGALALADNVDLLPGGVLEPRRGFALLATNAWPGALIFSGETNGPDTFGFMLMGSPGNGGARWNGLTFTGITSLLGSSYGLGYYDDGKQGVATRMRHAKAQRRLYFATAYGVVRLDPTAPVCAFRRAAPIRPSLDWNASSVSANGAGPLAPDTAVAYRASVMTLDWRRLEIEGPPSGRCILRNPSGGVQSAGVVRVLLKDGYGSLEAGDTLRLHRSKSVTPATAEPSDDVYLVAEVTLTASHLSAGYVDVTDLQADALLLTGGAAYYATSREGPSRENGHPPACIDVAVWDDCLWAGNCTRPAFLELRLLATGGTQGLAAGDYLRLNASATDYDFTGVTSAPAANQFRVYATGAPFDDIEKTALSLVSAINASSAATRLRAFYVSSAGEIPGLIRLEDAAPAAGGFSVLISAHPNAWGPQLPVVGVNSPMPSELAVFPAQVARSKPGLPSAFTPEDVFDVGDGADPLLRLVPLQDRLLIFKRRSTWAIYGTAPYQTQLVSAEAGLVAQDSPAVLQSTCFALTTLGWLSFSASGIEAFGARLDDILRPSYGGSSFSDAWACALPEQRRVLLGISIGVPTSTIAFHALAGGFTRYTRGFVDMGVHPDGTVYAVMADGKLLTQNLIGYPTPDADYADEGGAAYTCKVRWHPLHLGAPEKLKQLSQLKLHFQTLRLAAGTVRVATDKSGAYAAARPVSRTGYTPGQPFTDDGLPRNHEAAPPREKTLGCWFSVEFEATEAKAMWRLSGLTLDGAPLSDRESR